MFLLAITLAATLALTGIKVNVSQSFRGILKQEYSWQTVISLQF
jgi:hypothetical protein